MKSFSSGKSLRGFYLLFLFLVMSFSTQSSYAESGNENSQQNCLKNLSSLEAKNKNLSAGIISLDALLSAKGTVDLPLAVLFQVDLNDDQAITQKISEYSVLVTDKAVLEHTEFEPFKSCQGISKYKRLLSETISKQVELNEKKLIFLNLDKSARDALISSYQLARQQRVDKQQIDKQRSDSKEYLEKAQANLIKSEKDANQEERIDDEKLVTARSLLERFIVDIETEHIQFIDNIK